MIYILVISFLFGIFILNMREFVEGFLLYRNIITEETYNLWYWKNSHHLMSKNINIRVIKKIAFYYLSKLPVVTDKISIHLYRDNLKIKEIEIIKQTDDMIIYIIKIEYSVRKYGSLLKNKKKIEDIFYLTMKRKDHIWGLYNIDYKK